MRLSSPTLGQKDTLLHANYGGKQHCQKGTPNFLVEVLKLARQITDKPLLIRLDSGNDSADNIGIFMEECFRGQGAFHH